MTYAQELEKSYNEHAVAQNHINALPIEEAKEAIIKIADEKHKQYPQYKEHWNGAAWQLGRILKRVRTKFGVAFEVGDIVIFKYGTYFKWNDKAGKMDEVGCYTAYSVRNGIDTSLDIKKIKEIKGEE